MMWWRAGNSPALLVWCALAGCSQLLGADDLDYTRGAGGRKGAGGEAGAANAHGQGGKAGELGQAGSAGEVDERGGGAGGGDAGHAGRLVGAGNAGTRGDETGNAGTLSEGGQAGTPGAPGASGMHGGAAGNAGNAGTGGAAGDGGSPSSGSCAGRAGPASVNIAGKFCIDSTEVTNRDYREFLNAPAPIEQPPECSWNRDTDALRPRSDPPWPPADALLDYPVNGVDWCDAWAYCHWAGKRLCSRVDGSPPQFNDYATLQSELYYACSGGVGQAHPYGDTFEPDACAVGPDAPSAPVKSSPRCVGGYPGLYDLVGSVAEWQEACVASVGPEDNCRLGPLGVWFGSAPLETWSCAADHTSWRSAAHSGFGIRCCSDAL